MLKELIMSLKNASVDKKSARLGFVGLNTTLHLVKKWSLNINDKKLNI